MSDLSEYRRLRAAAQQVFDVALSKGLDPVTPEYLDLERAAALVFDRLGGTKGLNAALLEETLRP